MSTRAIRIGSAVALVALIAVPAAAAADEEAEERIRELNRQWVEAVAEGDVDAILEVYAEDARVFAPGMPPLEGREAIRAYQAQILEIPDFRLDFEPVTVRVAESGELAYVVGTYQLSLQGPEGAVEDHGHFVDIWERGEDGDWQVVVEIYNSDAPVE